jgi:hypothetical protein
MTMGFYVPTNKDVKFPKACEQCYFYDGLLCCVLDTYIYDPENKHGECPLIEVQPHGDLIDRDALTAKFKEMGLGEHSLIERLFADGVYVMIDYAPTIIPAEEGE